MSSVAPARLGADHGVEDGQELAHASDQRHLGQLARGEQMLVMRLDGGVMDGGGQSGHVERAAHLEATTGDATPAVSDTGIVGDGRHTDQSADLAASQPAEFGQGGDQGSAGDRADATGGTQQRMERGEVLLDMSLHLRVDVFELGTDRGDQGVDAGSPTPQRGGKLHGPSDRLSGAQTLPR